jgi:hypothetical protein
MMPVDIKGKHKVKTKQVRLFEPDRKKICGTCGVVMEDCEPAAGVGEWYHPKTGRCPHDGERVNSPYSKKKSKWAKSFRRKRDRRAHNRAVKAIRKLKKGTR